MRARLISPIVTDSRTGFVGVLGTQRSALALEGTSLQPKTNTNQNTVKLRCEPILDYGKAWNSRRVPCRPVTEATRKDDLKPLKGDGWPVLRQEKMNFAALAGNHLTVAWNMIDQCMECKCRQEGCQGKRFVKGGKHGAMPDKIPISILPTGVCSSEHTVVIHIST